jgi:ribose transport system substrate-binding protein
MRIASWACLVLLAVGCGLENEGGVPIEVGRAPALATAVEAAQTIRLGAVLPTFGHPFFLAEKKGMEAKARELGVAIEVRDGQEDDQIQIEQMRALFSLGCSALILSACDEKAVVPAIEAANRARLPVVALNRRVHDGRLVCYVGFDDLEGGKLQGQALADALGTPGGAILYLDAPKKKGTHRERSEGFGAFLDDYPEITIASVQLVDPDQDRDHEVMKRILRKYQPGEIRAIVCQSDDIALAAAAVARDQEWTDLIVIGFDGTSAAFDAIRAGTLYATILQDASEQGAQAVQAAVDYLHRKYVPEEQLTPPTIITKEKVGLFTPAY